MSHTVFMDQIEVRDDRQRKTFNEQALQELVDDILVRGLMHPLVVTHNPEGSNYPYRLIAGGRRYRALHMLYEQGGFVAHDGSFIPANTVPVVILGGSDADQSELALREAELAENTIRQDLTWQEKTAARAELHALRSEQNPKQTYRDTANEISRRQGKPENTSHSVEQVSRSVIISEFLDDPEIAAAQSEREAFRLVSQKLQDEFAAALDKTTIEQESPHVLLMGDAIQLMAELPSNHFACVVTDPPYGIDTDKFGDAADIKSDYKDTPDHARELIEQAAHALTRVCSKHAHVYMCCDWSTLEHASLVFQSLDWRVRRAPLIWDKGSAGHLSEGSVLGFRRSYEVIMVASRGDRQFTRLEGDVIKDCPPDTIRDHQAQKPVSLYKKLLSLSCDVGESVLDPFAGSGPIFDAADQLDLEATGIELSEKSVKIIENLRGVYRKG